MELVNNVKQIGTINKGAKIYIEDYVMTFIKYMEDKYVCDDLVFTLFGNLKNVDDENVLFINGIAGSSETEPLGSIKVFSEKGRTDIEKTREKYFKDSEVVGWAYVQPGFGDFLNEDHISYHLSNFKKPFQVLYITDPMDKSRVFYRQKPNSLELKPINGYFIYYDKNEAMHDYLIDVKKEGALEDSPKENITENVDNMINVKLRGSDDEEKKKSDLFSFSKLLKDIGPDIQKTTGLMSGLSFALLFVTLIIGGGLLRSNSRIAVLERQLSSLGRNYVSLREEMDVKTEEVFAAAQARADAETEAVTETEEHEEQQPTTAAPQAKDEENGETAEAAPEPSFKEYTVKSGDTLIYLSRYFYGTEDRVDDIMAANNMSEGDYLIEGKTIRIPE